MEYKILGGDEPPYGVGKFKNLENQINAVLSAGGSTVGGLIISTNGYPYQAVMRPVKPVSGGARKTRKQRR